MRRGPQVVNVSRVKAVVTRPENRPVFRDASAVGQTDAAHPNPEQLRSSGRGPLQRAEVVEPVVRADPGGLTQVV